MNHMNLQTTEELEKFVNRARSLTIDSFFATAKQLVKKYNDQDTQIITLLAADVVWSYFQDLFPTTHYLDVVGDNDTGKSSIGYTFEYLGYRPVKVLPSVLLTITEHLE